MVDTPPAAVSTSTPPSLVHDAVGKKAPFDVKMSSASVSSLEVPVSPVSVTLDPASRAKLDKTSTVIVLGADAMGLLCTMLISTDGSNA